MNSYIIILNLSFSEERYTALSVYLKSTITWARPMPNVWLIKTGRTAASIRDGIKQRIRSEDKALVIGGKNNDWASLRINPQVTDWMKTKF